MRERATAGILELGRTLRTDANELKRKLAPERYVLGE